MTNISPITNSTPVKKRIPTLDLLKLMCFMSVVWRHCAGMYHTLHPTLFVEAIESFLEVSMPLYCMVTGYVLLGRPLHKSTYSYSIKRILNFIKVLVASELLVLLFFHFWDGETVTVASAWQEFIDGFFLYRGRFMVSWFIFTLAILYLAYPLVNYLYVSRRKWFFYLMGGCVLIMTVVNIGSIFGQAAILNFEQTVVQQYKLYVWIFYFCLGGVVKIYQHSRWAARLSNIWLVIGLVIFCAVMKMPSFRTIIGVPDIDWTYCSPTVMLTCICIFLFFINWDYNHRFLDILPPLFFPAFITAEAAHVVWHRHVQFLPSNIGIIIFVGLSAVTGLLAAYVVTYTPYLNILFRTKKRE